MIGPGYIVYGRDHTRTAILCPREVNHVRRSWTDHERCATIMVGSSMLFSENVPHSGRDEEDHIDALEMVRATLIEGRKAGAVDFFIGVDINIELRLGNAGEDLHGFASIEWCGQYGPECEDGGEDVITYEKEIRWLPSTWTNSENRSQSLASHLAGLVFSGLQNNSITLWWPKDIRSTTWPVIVKIEERDLRTEEGSEMLGGLDPCIRGREKQFPRACTLLKW